jgi:hypothetical protein
VARLYPQWRDDQRLMLKKVFLQTQFGSPHQWTEQYFENFRQLERWGWYLKVFTPNPWPSASNIEVIPMTVEEFDELLGKKTGVRAGNHLKNGVPAKLVSDYYPAYGVIFEDFINGSRSFTESKFDYWGFTNWDVAYGRLDRFIPDSVLCHYDVWTDDPYGINGIFTLMRNDERVNNLFRWVPDWERCFAEHPPQAFDEIRMSETLRKLAAADKVNWGHPKHFPLHSYDRLVQHQPNPRVYFEEDGALIEWFDDYVHPPSEKRHFGREIFLMHFSRTKRWPVGPKPA